MKKTLLMASLFVASNQVLADQCAYIAPQHAYDAYRFIQPGDTIYSLCEPCGARVATAELVEKISLQDQTVDGVSYLEVLVNDVGIDLAYTYVRTGTSTVTNLSKLVGCPSDFVTPFLDL